MHNSFSYFEEEDDIVIVDDEDVKNADALEEDDEDVKKADATRKDNEDIKNADATEKDNEDLKNAEATENDDEDVKDDTQKDDERKVFESKEMSSWKASFDGNLTIVKKGKCKTKKRKKLQKQSTWENNVIISLTNVRNKFSIFGYLTEKEIEAIANSDSPELDSKRKKCRRCNFKKYCHLNAMACTALHRNCTRCAKPGHFPQSKNCKATRKNKFQSKIKCQVASGFFNLKTNESEMEMEPFKFIMSPELLRLVEQRIKLIEKEISQSDLK